ncbi:MAG: tRNA (guanosine(46)-N7)-methyltransferase TrmB [Lachnospiraceae bacterium]|nr:tRNA (guanosine(46)-N7)-methyltransferase TrmB [Lachnospiraceae bacterium]
MRLRHIPEADEAILTHKLSVQNPENNKGNWSSVFKNANPIRIEIGMGKGKFLTRLATLNKDINYVGMERYSSVLYRALQKMDSLDEPLDNIIFICEDAKNLADFFEQGEIDRIYLNFSDPWPKDRHAKRRLTSPVFLDVYSKLLSSGHTIEFKTDNRLLFDYSVETIKEYPDFDITEITYDLHNDAKMNIGNVMTEYEEKFSSQGNPIFKLIAKRK